MPQSYELPHAKDEGLSGSVTALCRTLLEKRLVDAILVPQHLPRGGAVQHTLVTEPRSLREVDPVAPILPVNGGVLAARLTRQDPGGSVAAVLRPCEIRAFVELVKLHQGERDRVLILGADCLGTFEPSAYLQWAKGAVGPSEAFLGAMMATGAPPAEAPDLRRCCQACEYCTPEGADAGMLFVGTEASIIASANPRGDELLEGLGLSPTEIPATRNSALADLVGRRIASRDQLIKEVEEEILPLGNLLAELALCVNCHNCRNVCPVCYCKGCVMDSSTMEHSAAQYVQWAKRKGAIKMPTDTLFYHMTRMAHMSSSCVGCGQCSSACPMGIRVAEIFRTVGRRTQAAFGYVPGRSLEEPLPLATFKEDELEPR
jgi:formate dehydrogenase (coenzyme F420) beta subunit